VTGGHNYNKRRETVSTKNKIEERSGIMTYIPIPVRQFGNLGIIVFIIGAIAVPELLVVALAMLLLGILLSIPFKLLNMV